MTNKQYLDNLQADVEKLRSFNSQKKRRRRRIVAIILAVGSALSCGAGALFTKTSRDRIYDGFKDDPSSISAEYLYYRDTFELWNSRANCNDINALLGGGKVYSQDGIAVLPAATGGYEILENGTSVGSISDNDISYINVYDGNVIFRDDTSRYVLCCDDTGANMTTLIEHRCGQVVIYGGCLYYINQDDGNRLYCVDLGDNSSRQVIDTPILNFIVCEDAIFFLDTGNNLRQLSNGSSTATSIVNHVERFFINGNIVAESANKVFQFRPSGGASELIMESQSESFRLVSCSAEAIYYQDAGKLHRLADGVDTVLAEGDYVHYISLLEADDGHIYVIAYSDPAGSSAYSTLLTLQADVQEVQ